jgi:hypothetical protein
MRTGPIKIYNKFPMSARALCGVILEKSLDLEKKVFHFLFINRRDLQGVVFYWLPIHPVSKVTF